MNLIKVCREKQDWRRTWLANPNSHNRMFQVSKKIITTTITTITTTIIIPVDVNVQYCHLNLYDQ